MCIYIYIHKKEEKYLHDGDGDDDRGDDIDDGGDKDDDDGNDHT